MCTLFWRGLLTNNLQESIRLEDFLCQMHEVRAYELETLKDKRQEEYVWLRFSLIS